MTNGRRWSRPARRRRGASNPPPQRALRPARHYESRFMYGKTTAAVVYPTLGILLSAVCIVAGQSEDNGKALALELAECRFDNMGHDFIAY
jgi:hypothetical protein